MGNRSPSLASVPSPGATVEDGFSALGMKMAAAGDRLFVSEVVTLMHIPGELACCEARTAVEGEVLTSGPAPLLLPSNSESKTYKQAVLVNSS